MTQLSVYRYQYTDYLLCQQQMRSCALDIANSNNHQLWLVEHQSVFTLGQVADKSHLLATGDIPVVQSNRGGQVTWHGPGQIILYTLLNLATLKIHVRQLVTILENSVIDLLANYHIKASARKDAPGVYVQEKKIASVGLRISKSVSYHGLSFNHSCSLEPFSRIHTCGYPELEVTRLKDMRKDVSRHTVEKCLCDNIARYCGLTLRYQETIDE